MKKIAVSALCGLLSISSAFASSSSSFAVNPSTLTGVVSEDRARTLTSVTNGGFALSLTQKEHAWVIAHFRRFPEDSWRRLLYFKIQWGEVKPGGNDWYQARL